MLLFQLKDSLEQSLLCETSRVQQPTAQRGAKRCDANCSHHVRALGLNTNSSSTNRPLEMVLPARNRKRQRECQRSHPRPDPIETDEDLDCTQRDPSTDSSQTHEVRQAAAANRPSPLEPNRYHSPKQSCWAQRYSDIHSQTGLAVSTKKFNELVGWLALALEHNAPRFLVLSGPPGCGKRSAVTAACEKLRCTAVSWDAPLTGARGISTTLIEDFQSFVIGTRYQSLVSAAVDEPYDLNSSKSQSTECDSAKERPLLVINDLPLHTSDLRVHSETLQQLFGNIARFAPYPAILLLSDNEKGIHRLSNIVLGSSLLDSQWVGTISIPPVTTSMMKKRLQQILAVENIAIPRDQLDMVVSSSNGDIRSALNNLELSIIRTEHPDPNNAVERARRRKKRPRVRNERTKACLMELDRDVTLSTYHAVSKILNNKKAENGRSRYIAEHILDEARIDPSTFISFLHHNYPDFFGNSDDVVPALTCLSEADTLLPWRQEDEMRVDLRECAASIVTRGFLYFNTQPNRSGWRPIHGPECHKIWRAGRNHVQYTTKLCTSRRQPHVCTRSEVCETLPYANKITELSASRYVPSASNATEAQKVVCNEARIESTNGRMSKLETIGNKTMCDNAEEEDLIDPIEDWDDSTW